VTPITVLLNMTTSSGRRFPCVDPFVQHAVSYPSSPPRSAYKRSSSGTACFTRVVSISSSPKIGGISSPQEGRFFCSSPSPPLQLEVEEGSLVVSSALRKTCQSPIRGHDPD
jgi:hypothetical protein